MEMETLSLLRPGTAEEAVQAAERLRIFTLAPHLSDAI